MYKLLMMLFAASGVLSTQTPVANPGEPYRIVAAGTSALESKLNEAAGAGYRLILADGAEKRQITLLLEKVSEAEPYAYKVLSTNRISTMQREIDQYATDGYRVVPRASFGLFVVLEKPPQPPPSPKYKLVAATAGLTGTMEKRIAQAAQEGFSICCVHSGADIVIMQKALEPNAATTNPSPAYVLFTKEQSSAMEKELNQRAASGYRLIAGTQGQTIAGAGRRAMALFMEKTSGSYSYRIVQAGEWFSEGKEATLESELNAAAFEGYRLVPGAVTEKEKAAKGGVFGRAVRDTLAPTVVTATMNLLAATEIVAVMERGPEPLSRYEYRIGLAKQAELSQGAQDGFKPVTMALIQNARAVPVSTLVLIMERKVP